MADAAAFVPAKHKIKAKASGISYQQYFQLFVQREFFRKLLMVILTEQSCKPQSLKHHSGVVLSMT
ncbi:MAG: hypothetical protein PHG06_18905 [Parabacteroides sp.]|nr:hypothetical protein [Parabacteroides sp.]